MAQFLLRRAIQGAVVLLVMSFIVFVGVFAIGDPVRILLAPDATDVEVTQATARLGLDRPLPEQYLRFAAGALRGELGDSFVHGRPALGLILERLPATLELALTALLLAVGIGLPLGLIAGLRADTALGRSIGTAAIIGFSLPTFWIALILMLVFSVQLGWLPSFGRGPVAPVLGIPTSLGTLEGLTHLLMPAATLALFKIALVVRLTQAGVEETMAADFVRFARAKGLHPRRIVGVHVLKNILIPLVTVLGLQFGSLIAFSVVTEKIFAWPGIGKLLIDSIGVLDRPVIVAYLLLTVALFVVLNLVVDLLYAAIDPRVRMAGKAG
jgi:peptide/nickel transport system permease protein